MMGGVKNKEIQSDWEFIPLGEVFKLTSGKPNLISCLMNLLMKIFTQSLVGMESWDSLQNLIQKEKIS